MGIMYRIISANIVKLRARQLIFGSAIQGRKFATEEVEKKSQTELSENEKDLAGVVEILTKKVASLKEKNEDFHDKYTKALKDSENLRLGLIKQIEDAKLFGIQGFCRDLIEVADIFFHTTKGVPLDEISKKDPHFKNVYESWSMTHASLMKVLRRHGLQPIDPTNQKYDPKLHEVVFEKEVEDVEPNTVVEVNRIGYKLHERCIRPALVSVSKAT